MSRAFQEWAGQAAPPEPDPSPLAAKGVHDEGKVGKVLVVDLDAHQGNGTAAVFHGWDWASIYDLYERDIFPARKEPEDYPLPVGPGLTGVEYLGIVRDTLPGALDAVRPDLGVYNAGSDPYAGDPLARYRLTAGDLAERDMLLATEVRGRIIPVGPSRVELKLACRWRRPEGVRVAGQPASAPAPRPRRFDGGKPHE